uniref:ATP synthase subunit a n=1 Tax=Geomydoecus aurei TaxID=161607 RepID=A0A8F4MDB4_9NEOP|nr:ATP synthase F0 subunit 6 [Geomydoecus aurei]
MSASILSSFDPVIYGTSLPVIGKITWSLYLLLSITGGSSSSSVLFSTVIGMMGSILWSSIRTYFKKYYGLGVALVGLFTMLIMLNFLGLMPFNPSCTSSMSVNFPISFVIWVTGLIWLVMNFRYFSVSHFVPIGSPMVLAPFLVVVEVISNIIRPMSLAVRLMSNMVAGHMILNLVWESTWVSTYTALILSIFSMGFMLFEFAVCIIQAYVFSTLSSLYWEEVNH